MLDTFQHLANNLTFGEKQVCFTLVSDLNDLKFYFQTLQQVLTMENLKMIILIRLVQPEKG